MPRESVELLGTEPDAVDDWVSINFLRVPGSGAICLPDIVSDGECPRGIISRGTAWTSEI